MANRAKQKGDRIEREIVELHKDLEIDAQRIPLSGAAGGHFVGDIKIGNIIAEVKARSEGSGFKMLEKWLGDNHLLFLRQDRKNPLVVIPWDVYSKMICQLGNNWFKEFIR